MDNEVQVELTIRQFGKVRHTITKTLTYESMASGGGWFIRAAAPELCDGRNMVFEGRGDSISQVVLSWLTALCGSMAYVPRYYIEEGRHGDRVSALVVPAAEERKKLDGDYKCNECGATGVACECPGDRCDIAAAHLHCFICLKPISFRSAV
ncbi:MAG: hypothetical protein RL681_680 [Candidatus Parcubacteria bacterium]|jgi:hypothetical protein